MRAVLKQGFFGVVCVGFFLVKIWLSGPKVPIAGKQE